MIKKILTALTVLAVTALAPLTAAAPLFPQTPGVVSYTYRDQFKKDFNGTLVELEQA
jgi:hypothetical protein